MWGWIRSRDPIHGCKGVPNRVYWEGVGCEVIEKALGRTWRERTTLGGCSWVEDLQGGCNSWRVQ